MTNQIQLSSEAIYKQEFKKSVRGYNEEEVDRFLDIIIQDYELFTRQINQLKKELEHLKQQPVERRPVSNQTQINSNYDVLKRLSNLEKVVFGKKQLEDEL